MKPNLEMQPCVYSEEDKRWVPVCEFIEWGDAIHVYKKEYYNGQMHVERQRLDVEKCKNVWDKFPIVFCVLCPIENRFLPIKSFCSTCGGCSRDDK